MKQWLLFISSLILLFSSLFAGKAFGFTTLIAVFIFISAILVVLAVIYCMSCLDEMTESKN